MSVNVNLAHGHSASPFPGVGKPVPRPSSGDSGYSKQDYITHLDQTFEAKLKKGFYAFYQWEDMDRQAYRNIIKMVLRDCGERKSDLNMLQNDEIAGYILKAIKPISSFHKFHKDIQQAINGVIFFLDRSAFD